MLSHRSAAKRAALREHHWPDSGDKIWPPGKKEGGWTKVPRTICVIAQVFSENSKGEDLLQTYLELLSRNPEEGIVELEREEEHAALSGFAANQRGVKSWRTRIQKLEELGFIRTFTGSRGLAQVVLRHPTQAMTSLRKKKGVSDPLWADFNRFLIDTGQPAVTDEDVAAADSEEVKTGT